MHIGNVKVLLQLRSSPAGLDATLARVLRVGVAFHHAGLTTEERDIVELVKFHKFFLLLVHF